MSDEILVPIRLVYVNGTRQKAIANLEFVHCTSETVEDTPSIGERTLKITPIADAPAGTFTPEQYGAVGDGVTDDTAAFVAMYEAMAAGSVAIFGAKTYVVDGGDLRPPPGTTTLGQGPATLIKTTAAVPLFKILNGDDTELGNFNIQGNGVSTGVANGIVSGYLGGDGANRLRVHNIIAFDFGDVAFSAAYGPVGTIPGVMFLNCRAVNCTRGFDCYQYMQVLGCAAVGCGIGLNLQAGNCLAVGSDFSGNTIGINLAAGGNDGHSVVSGCQINHCSTHALLVAAGLSNGQVFRDCHFYGSDITIGTAGTGSVEFVGCTVDPSTYNFDGALARFHGCTFPMGNTNTVSESGTPDIEFTDCRGIDGTIPAFIRAYLRQTFTFGSDADAALTKKASRAPELVVAAGTISTTRKITSTRPPQQGVYQRITNNNAQTVNFAWSTGTAVSIGAGMSALVGSDGTNAIIATDAGALTSLGSVATLEWANSVSTGAIGTNKAAAILQLLSDTGRLSMQLDWNSGLITALMSMKISTGFLDITQIAEPASPASGAVRVYVDSADGKLKAKDPSGVVHPFW